MTAQTEKTKCDSYVDHINSLKHKHYVVNKTDDGYWLSLSNRKAPLHIPVSNLHEMILYLRGFLGGITS